jgi:hypothetical protein
LCKFLGTKRFCTIGKTLKSWISCQRKNPELLIPLQYIHIKLLSRGKGSVPTASWTCRLLTGLVGLTIRIIAESISNRHYLISTITVSHLGASIFFFFFLKVSLCSLKIMIFPSQSPKCWNYRCAPPCSALHFLSF